MNELPKNWSLWRHKSGNLYRVITFTNMSTGKPKQYPVTIIYEDANTGDIWSRPLEDWHRSIKEVGE